MKVNKKIAFVLFLIILILTTAITGVQAADFGLQLTGSKDKIKPGETITLQVSLKDIEKMSTGLNIVLANIDYDKNVFETVKEEDIKALSDWSGMMYNEDNGKVIIENYNFNEGQKAMLEITLKAKTELSQKETSISIKGVESSMGQDSMSADDTSLTLKIQQDNVMLIIIIGSILILALVIGIVIYFILKKKKGEQ